MKRLRKMNVIGERVEESEVEQEVGDDDELTMD